MFMLGLCISILVSAIIIYAGLNDLSESISNKSSKK